ncbi:MULTISPECIES: outer membrane protein [Marinobacter]|uniref:outer membrane protein n=1 Tax=Marinobacter TaxID=2742 RepID=UPI000DAC3CDF|nr:MULTISPECIES: outer membrane beta-barrel protein [Marinobacter]
MHRIGILALLLVVPILPGVALADRAGTWDFSVQMVGNLDETSRGDNDSRLDIDSDLGLAFGGAYHATEHLQFGVDLTFLNPDYEARFNIDGGGTRTVKTELDVFNTHIYGAWNFMEGPLTPYVRAGLGWTYIDSNIISSDVPVGVCWWDPWLGYVCSATYNTYDDTQFSYGAGAGVRYEFGEHYFVQAGFDHFELTDDDLGASPDFDVWRIQFGWRVRYW